VPELRHGDAEWEGSVLMCDSASVSEGASDAGETSGVPTATLAATTAAGAVSAFATMPR
jgi:hypothetical protein